MSLITPVQGRLTDGYGPRGVVPGLGDLGFHTGRDISAAYGTRIVAAHSGVVSRTWWDAYPNGAGAGGWMVEIRGDDGLTTRYAHMAEACHLPVGSRVIGGVTTIGYVGSSGAATGAHLHFEVLTGGRYTDPDPYLTGSIEGEDDMSAKAEAQIDAIYQGMYGPANAGGGTLKWASVDGARSAAYGVLDIDIHTQGLVAKLIGQQAALLTAVQQLAGGSGTVDMAALEKAAEKGARDALSGLTLKAEVKG